MNTYLQLKSQFKDEAEYKSVGGDQTSLFFRLA